MLASRASNHRTERFEVTLRDCGAFSVGKIKTVASVCSLTIKQVQIFWRIILRVFIDMVDNLSFSKESTKNFFGNMSVLQNPSITVGIWMPYNNNRFVFRSSTSFPTRIVYTCYRFCLALFTTKFSLSSFSVSKTFGNWFTTYFAWCRGRCSHGVSFTCDRTKLAWHPSGGVGLRKECLATLLTYSINHIHSHIIGFPLLQQ